MKANTHQEFLDWYQVIHQRFVRYCRTKGHGIMETEDLVQEAVLATLQGFYRIQNKEKLLSFMIGVVNNIIKNKLRRKKFSAELDERALEKLESQVTDPELALDIHYLHKAIQQLPEKQKEALLLFEISGFSIKEVSKIQDSSESATKTRLSRARKALKTLLSEEINSMSLSNRLAIYASILF